ASDELNPAKARILLMLALLKERSLAEIQQLYDDY
nr:L-asparaginase 2 [Desulfobacterales bacterium]